MDLKRLITNFTYRIEPKHEGGFIARASDPNTAPIEAPTREELQRRIQENIAASLAAEFPGLKLPLDSQGLKYSFHVEGKPGGGFAIHSADPNAQPIEGASHEEIESHFAEKLMAFVGKHFMPELAQAMAQGISGEVKVFVNRQTGFAGSHTFGVGTARALAPSSSLQPTMKDGQSAAAKTITMNAKTMNANFGSGGGSAGNSPITFETSSRWIVSLFLLILLLGSLTYFFFHYR